MGFTNRITNCYFKIIEIFDLDNDRCYSDYYSLLMIHLPYMNVRQMKGK